MKTNTKKALGVGVGLALLGGMAYDNREDLKDLYKMGKGAYKLHQKLSSVKSPPKRTEAQEKRLEQYRKYVNREREDFDLRMYRNRELMGRYGREFLPRGRY